MSVTSMVILNRPVYAPLWAAARRRLEANGLSLTGASVTLKGLAPNESDAIAGLLGVRRPVAGSAFRVRLPVLDEALRSSSIGIGLIEVLSAFGGPLVDRKAAKASAVTERARQFSRLRTHAAVIRDERLDGWLYHVEQTGLDRRLGGADGISAVEVALDVLAAVGVLGGTTNHRLPALAASVTGDAHALDRGRAAGTLAVSALASLACEPFPRDAADWRRVWAEAGVACDDLSCDVLVLNLPGFAAEPLRLTLRQVLAWQPAAAAPGIAYVCENPAVVAAAADVGSGLTPPVVCLDGMPSTAALIVLTRLAEHGHAIAYHGDFDWRGLTIANVLARKLPCTTPWRYELADYDRAIAAGLGTIELTGRPTQSPWDTDLAYIMEGAGLAIYEEQVLDELLSDLTDWCAVDGPV